MATNLRDVGMRLDSRSSGIQLRELLSSSPRQLASSWFVLLFAHQIRIMLRAFSVAAQIAC